MALWITKPQGLYDQECAPPRGIIEPASPTPSGCLTATVSCSAGSRRTAPCRSELARDQGYAASGSVVFRHRGSPVRNGPLAPTYCNGARRIAEPGGAKEAAIAKVSCSAVPRRTAPVGASLLAIRGVRLPAALCSVRGSPARTGRPPSSYGFKVAAVWVRSKRAPMCCSGCVPDSGSTEPQATPQAARDGARSAAPAPCRPSAGSDERSSAAG